jgi:hypothetical protein
VSFLSETQNAPMFCGLNGCWCSFLPHARTDPDRRTHGMSVAIS